MSDYAGPLGRRARFPALARIEAELATRRGVLALVGVALAVYAVESIALPVIPGRDLGTYLRFYAQMWDWGSALPMTMLFRTPLAPLVIGATVDLAGGWGAQVLLAALFAGSIVAWTWAALAFGRRAALVTAAALVLYPGYGILFHALSSDAVFAAAFAGWGLAVSRAVVRPTPTRFALVGVAIVATALSRPGNQVLILSALLPLALALPWRRRLACAASCAAVAVLLLGAWVVNNGLRYDDYALARGGQAYLPFFRAFTTDHIVSPDNGPASRALAGVVERELLTQEPYRSYGVTTERFFTRAGHREFEDVLSLTDRVWGWDSDHAMMRKVGLEAVRAHPGVYARGVVDTFVEELWQPLHVSLPARATAAAVPGASAASGPVDASSGETRAAVSRLPVPTDGAQIPAARQGIFSSTPDRSVREVWTSPAAHQVVFDDERERRRWDAAEAKAASLAAGVPPYPGSDWLTLQFSRSSKLYPPPLLWLVAGTVGLLLRLPARAGLALALALGGLLVTLLNALTIYPIIEFAVPIVPALVVFAAAGLVGERRTSVHPSSGG